MKPTTNNLPPSPLELPKETDIHSISFYQKAVPEGLTITDTFIPGEEQTAYGLIEEIRACKQEYYNSVAYELTRQEKEITDKEIQRQEKRKDKLDEAVDIQTERLLKQLELKAKTEEIRATGSFIEYEVRIAQYQKVLANPDSMDRKELMAIINEVRELNFLANLPKVSPIDTKTLSKLQGLLQQALDVPIHKQHSEKAPIQETEDEEASISDIVDEDLPDYVVETVQEIDRESRIYNEGQNNYAAQHEEDKYDHLPKTLNAIYQSKLRPFEDRKLSRLSTDANKSSIYRYGALSVLGLSVESVIWYNLGLTTFGFGPLHAGVIALLALALSSVLSIILFKNQIEQKYKHRNQLAGGPFEGRFNRIIVRLIVLVAFAGGMIWFLKDTLQHDRILRDELEIAFLQCQEANQSFLFNETSESPCQAAQQRKVRQDNVILWKSRFLQIFSLLVFPIIGLTALLVSAYLLAVYTLFKQVFSLKYKLESLEQRFHSTLAGITRVIEARTRLLQEGKAIAGEVAVIEYRRKSDTKYKGQHKY